MVVECHKKESNNQGCLAWNRLVLGKMVLDTGFQELGRNKAIHRLSLGSDRDRLVVTSRRGEMYNRFQEYSKGKHSLLRALGMNILFQVLDRSKWQ